MDEHATLKQSPLSHLDYFVEWGSEAWARMVRTALIDYFEGDLTGKSVLDFGSRNGRLSCLFGLLGARVTGLEIHSECISIGRTEAEKFDIAGHVEFVRYSGDLRELAGRQFDVIFAKSVLVLLPDLREALEGLDRLLSPGGRVVFIENGIGGPLMRFARWVRHRGKWDYSGVQYFSDAQIELVRSFFDIDRIEKSLNPPIYLLCGRKRIQPSLCPPVGKTVGA